MKMTEKKIAMALDGLKEKSKIECYKVRKYEEIDATKYIGPRSYFDFVVNVSIDGMEFGFALMSNQVEKTYAADGIQGLEKLMMEYMDGYFIFGESLKDIVFSNDFEKARDILIARVRRVKDYPDPEDLIMRKVGDIALVLYFDAGYKNGLFGSVAVNRSFASNWGKSDEELLDLALQNSMERYPLSSSHMIAVYANSATTSTLGRVVGKKSPNGSIGMFDPGVLEQIAHLCDSSFYCVVPKEDHFLYLSEKDNDIDDVCIFKKALEKETSHELFSSEVYYYDEETHTLEAVPQQHRYLS